MLTTDDEINRKLDEINRKLDGPDLGDHLAESYDKLVDEGMKKSRTAIEGKRKKLGRSKSVGLAQDILGGGIVFIGFLICGIGINAQYPSQNYGSIILV